MALMKSGPVSSSHCVDRLPVCCPPAATAQTAITNPATSLTHPPGTKHCHPERSGTKCSEVEGPAVPLRAPIVSTQPGPAYDTAQPPQLRHAVSYPRLAREET